MDIGIFSDIDTCLLYTSFQFMASFWILVCFGVVGLPHTAVRCMAFKDSKALHRGMLIGTIVLSVIMLGMHLAGALGRDVYKRQVLLIHGSSP